MSEFMEVKLYGETPEQIKSNYEYLRSNGYSISKKCLVDESVFLEANCLFGSEDGDILRGGDGDDYCTYEEFLEEDGQEIDLHGFSDAVEADMVNNPKHYTSHPSGIECIEVTRHMGFNLGNATKYIWRCDLKKDAIEDLRKAIFYLNDEIELRLKQQENNK